MLYPMKCDTCHKVLDIGCPMESHTAVIKPGIKCNDQIKDGCNGTLVQIIMAPCTIINRSPFPGTGNEVQLPTNHGEDMTFRDKSEAKDWLGERGLMSKWIENDM